MSKRASSSVLLLLVLQWTGAASTALGEAPASTAAEAPASAPVASSSGSSARARFREAERFFGAGDFRRALESYQRAYALRPLPGLLFNIAQSLRNLGHCQDAVVYYRRFLAQRPQSRYADDVRRIIEQCAQEAGTERAAEQLTPPEQRRESDPPPPPQQQHRRLRSEHSGPPVVAIDRDRAGAEPNKRSGALLWTGVAVTGALAVAGTVTGVLALDRNRRYKAADTPATERASLRDSGQDLAVATTIMWSVGAASAAATALVYWFHYREDQRNPTAAVVAPLQGGLSIGVAGGF